MRHFDFPAFLHARHQHSTFIPYSSTPAVTHIDKKHSIATVKVRPNAWKPVLTHLLNTGPMGTVMKIISATLEAKPTACVRIGSQDILK